MAGVFAFAIFAHEDPVDAFSRIDCSQRGLDTREGFDGADIGVELHGTADGEEEAPERDVVGHVWSAY